MKALSFLHYIDLFSVVEVLVSQADKGSIIEMKNLN